LEAFLDASTAIHWNPFEQEQKSHPTDTSTATKVQKPDLMDCPFDPFALDSSSGILENPFGYSPLQGQEINHNGLGTGDKPRSNVDFAWADL